MDMAAISSFLRQFWAVWLMLLFVGILAWTLWPGRRKEMEEHAQIPLRDDDGRDDDEKER